METNSLFRYTKVFVTFIMVFIWTTVSLNAQCPTIIDSNPPAICDASGFTFTDLSTPTYVTDNGGGIAWYSSPTGGIPLSGLVTDGVTYYVDDLSGSCGTRTSITLNFQVSDSGYNLEGIYCSNEGATIQDYYNEILLPNIPSGGSIEIYEDSNLTVIPDFSDPIPSGGTIYYIVFVDGGCKSQTENGRTLVLESPSDPQPQDQTFCSSDSPTIAQLNPGTLDAYNWYASSDASGVPISSSANLIDGVTYYVRAEEVFCQSNTVPVQVTIDTPGNPGSSASLTYCNNNIPTADFDLFNEISTNGIPDTTGSWSGPVLTFNGNTGTVNISTLTTPGVYTFTYTVPDTGACLDATSSVTININEAPESGMSIATFPEFCEAEGPTSYNLFDLLTGEDQTGTWFIGTDNTGTSTPNTVDLSILSSGTYNFTYDVDLVGSCDDGLVTVSVIINPLPNTGTPDNPAPFCKNDAALSNTSLDLFTLLTGTVDAGGTWTDDSTAPVSGVLSGNILDLSQLVVNTYNFTYSITNANGCSNSTTVTIVIDEAPESGEAITTFPEYCEGAMASGQLVNLFDLLDSTQDTNGTWYEGTDTSVSGIVVSNSIDISSFTTNTYNYTYSVSDIGNCSDKDVTVQIIINPQPNSGTPSPATFCENDLAGNSPLDLFGQLTGNDLGGTWYEGSDNTGTVVVDPSAYDITGLVVGSYNFTYSVTNGFGCTNSSTVVVTIEPAPEPGTPIATFPEFCEGSAPTSFDLYTLIDGESGTGIWTNNNTSTTVVDPNSLDLSTFTANTYNFTFDIDGINGCDADDVVVSIIINPLPNTGIPNNPPPFCENDPALSNTTFDLSTLLNTPVDAGGQWYIGTDTTGTMISETLDLTTLTNIQVYNYTYGITDANACSNSTTVAITIVEAPESGEAITTFPEYCKAAITSSQLVNLFDLLDGTQDTNGTWYEGTDTSGAGTVVSNSIDISSFTENTYTFTYSVPDIGNCSDKDVTVQIIINDTPAPTANTPQEFCDSATVANLVTTSGTTIQWYDAVTEGNLLSDTTDLVDGQIYYATQTDAITGCESSVRTPVTATIYQSPNAGVSNSTGIVVCNNGTINLNTGLDGTQDLGGTWYIGSDNTGTVVVDPTAYDVTGLAANNYQFTYYVVASAPCLDDSETITVIIEAPLSAGLDGLPLELCSNNGTINLFSQLGGSPETGGIWSPALTSGTGVFDPLVDLSGTYTYSLTNACGTFSSQIEVTVTQAPNAGSDNTALICVIDGVTDLFPLLGTAAQSGGVWSPALASGTGEFDPSVDVSGIYTYTVVATGPCSPNAVAQIIVTVDDISAPIVVEANPEFCLVDNPTVSNLSSALTLTGTVNWYEDVALTIVAESTDNLIDGKTYYATQTNSAGCESSTSIQITAIINDVATPTLEDANQEYCINDNPAPSINDLTLNIAERDTNSVVWYDAEVGGDVISSSTLLTNLTSYYAVLVDATTGCESSVRLEVTPDITSCGKLDLPDGFSPNGDTVNDTFDYNNLDILYPNFEIEIFNRYGNVVYKGNASTPRFNGKSNQSRSIGNGDLPVGVYFYIFKFNDNANKPEQGRLYLSR